MKPPASRRFDLHPLTHTAMTTDTQRKLKVALFGVGRLGSIRARILVGLSPRIDLVAVCDPKPGSDQWVAENLPTRVKFFADPDECMLHSGADALLISTATATHAPLVLRALELDLHVMVEKPIAVDIETTGKVVEAGRKKPHLKLLVPFCRRCKSFPYGSSITHTQSMTRTAT